MNSCEIIEKKERITNFIISGQYIDCLCGSKRCAIVFRFFPSKVRNGDVGMDFPYLHYLFKISKTFY